MYDQGGERGSLRSDAICSFSLTWSTSNVISSIALQVNGQTLQTNLPASGQVTHCPTTPDTLVYTLIVTSSPYYGPINATQIVQAVAPPTATFTPTPTPTVFVQPL